jgi:hypothetical protein
VSDDALREALRDLIPDYTGPVDPLPRVVASVRRRRSRQRTLLVVGSAGLAAVLAVAAPALLLPGRTGGVQSAAPYQPDGPPAPPASGDVGRPAPAPPPVYLVAAGTIHGADWAIGTTTQSPGARRCLYSDDAVFARETVCFDDWKAGAAVTWNAQPLADKGLPVTRVVGVAPAGTAAVRVQPATGGSLTLPVTSTATDRTARFFGTVLPGTVAVRTVTALDATGTAVGRPVTDPGYTCHAGPRVACAPPK